MSRNQQRKAREDQPPESEGELGQVWALTGIVRGLQQEIIELRRWHNKATIREIVEEVYEEDVMRLETLRDDAVKILGLLVDAGVIDRTQLNEVIDR